MLLFLLLLILNQSVSQPFPTLIYPSNDAVLQTGEHILNFTCAIQREQDKSKYHLVIQIIGQEILDSKQKCNDDNILIKLRVTDPGSYFVHLVLLDVISNQILETTRSTFSFEIYTVYKSHTTSNNDFLSSPSFISPSVPSVTSPQPTLNIVHLSDLGAMDGYKGHLLQQLLLLPRAKYIQTVVDLSCVVPEKQLFRKPLEDWNIPIVSECIKVPQDRWDSIESWVQDLRSLDQVATLQEMELPMQKALSVLLDLLLKADIMVITNGAGDYDSYLIPLGRLTNTRVIMDLGPQGPLALPWTTNGLSRFVAQSTFVSLHPNVVATKIKTVLLPPMIDVNFFSKPSAIRKCSATNHKQEDKNEQRIEIKENGETTTTATTTTTSTSTSSTSIRIGFVGRLATQKGPGMFIRAASIAYNLLQQNQKDVQVTFVMAGIGSIEKELHALAKRLNVQIEWLGYVPNSKVSCVLHNLDIFIFSSLFEESFGMSPVEAMRMRLPVIGFGVGGSQDFLIHNETAIVVKERTPNGLANAMIDLIENNFKRRRIGRKAEEFVRGAYNPTDIVNGYKNMYHAVVSEDRSTVVN